MKHYGTVTLKKGSWNIEAEPYVITRMKRLFGKASKSQHGKVVLSDTLENCRELFWFLERYPMRIVDAGRYLMERAEEHEEQGERLLDILDGNFEPRTFELAIPPRQYQKIAAEIVLQSGSLLCCDDVGLGKTLIAIAALTDPKARPALVVTLTHLPRQWEAEIKKFAPGLKVHILKKGTPYPLIEKTPLLGAGEIPDVIISNYHKLSGWADALAGKINGVVFDEIQELRRDESAKYKAASHIAHKASIRLGLSATPIFNYAAELQSVLEVLKPGVLGTKEEFSREWAVGHKGSVKDPQALGLYLRDQGLMIRRTRKDVGRELPDVIVIPHHIDTDAEPLAEVESSVDELARIILAQGGETVRGERMRAAEELSWRLRQATGIAKAPHVADFVRLLVEQGETVLLAGWHRVVYEMWLDRLKDLKPAMYTGSESPAAKEKEVARFKSGETKVLIISLRAGAGLDGLQDHCRTVILGEVDWSPAVHTQLIGRLHRDGQNDPVVAYYLLSDQGSDPIVSGVLGIKRMQADGVIDPNGALVEQLTGDGDRIKSLAADYLRRRGLAVPKVAPIGMADPLAAVALPALPSEAQERLWA